MIFIVIIIIITIIYDHMNRLMQERDEARSLLNTLQIQSPPNGLNHTKAITSSSSSSTVTSTSTSTTSDRVSLQAGVGSSTTSSSTTTTAKESSNTSSSSKSSDDDDGKVKSDDKALPSEVTRELVEKCAELSTHRKGRKGMSWRL